MTSQEELNNIIQSLQQTIQQQQLTINSLEHQLNKYRADILDTENNFVPKTKTVKKQQAIIQCWFK